MPSCPSLPLHLRSSSASPSVRRVRPAGVSGGTSCRRTCRQAAGSGANEHAEEHRTAQAEGGIASRPAIQQGLQHAQQESSWRNGGSPWALGTPAKGPLRRQRRVPARWRAACCHGYDCAHCAPGTLQFPGASPGSQSPPGSLQAAQGKGPCTGHTHVGAVTACSYMRARVDGHEEAQGA